MPGSLKHVACISTLHVDDTWITETWNMWLAFQHFMLTTPGSLKHETCRLHFPLHVDDTWITETWNMSLAFPTSCWRHTGSVKHETCGLHFPLHVDDILDHWNMKHVACISHFMLTTYWITETWNMWLAFPTSCWRHIIMYVKFPWKKTHFLHQHVP